MAVSWVVCGGDIVQRKKFHTVHLDTIFIFILYIYIYQHSQDCRNSCNSLEIVKFSWILATLRLSPGILATQVNSRNSPPFAIFFHLFIFHARPRAGVLTTLHTGHRPDELSF